MEVMTGEVRGRLLWKPLNEVVREEEISSKVTREECRRYLKEKGMRRPSWNKSQAIQQVLSLKALLESPEEEEEDPIPLLTTTPRECATSGSLGQMTIFYSGKVNVYDQVSPHKARAIMQLAASPLQDDPLNINAAVRASPCHLPIDKDVHVPIDTTILQVAQPDKMVEYPTQYRERGSIARNADVEGQASRKVSLQRYFEKRKDRGRFKGKKLTGITSSNLEMYLNLQVKAHGSNGNSSRSSTSSLPQPRLPLAANQLKVVLPIDLNDKDVQEC